MRIKSFMLRGGIENMKFDVKEKAQWCPGCGNYLLLNALKMALQALNLETHEVVIVSGIGCGSKIPHYIRTYGYEGIHGRILPLAEGIKMANPTLTVIGVGGDGDGYSEGGNHFQHAARKNVDITYIVQDNSIYALTTGQASPTTHPSQTTKTTPIEKLYGIYKPLPVALAQGASFVAAAYAGHVKQTAEIIERAIKHKGFSFVNVYQPCVTWNKGFSYEWYAQRVYYVDGEARDFDKAMKLAFEPYNNNFEKIPLGVFYEVESEPLDAKHPVLKKGLYPYNNVKKRF